MGHSILVVDERQETFNDFDLMAIMGLALKLGENCPEFADVLDIVRQDLFTSGVGCFGFHLEQTPAPMRPVLLRLLDEVTTFVDGLGDTFPGRILNEAPHPEGVEYLDPVSSDWLRSALPRLRSLFEPTRTEPSPPFAH